MKSAKKSHNFVFNFLLMAAAVVITSFAVGTGGYVEYGNEESAKIAVGAVAAAKYKATAEVVNRIATERNQKEAAQDSMDMKPLRKKDPAINEKVLKSLHTFTLKLDEIRFVYAQEQAALAEAAKITPTQVPPPPEAEEAFSEDLETGVPAFSQSSQGGDMLKSGAPNSESPSSAPDSIDAFSGSLEEAPEEQTESPTQEPTQEPTPDPTQKTDLPPSPLEQLHLLQVTLSDAQAKLLLSVDEEHYEKLKAAIGTVLAEVLDQGVQEVDAKSLKNIQDVFQKIDLSGEMIEIGYQIATTCLQPNYVIDEEATAKARAEIASQYQVVKLIKGQTIVDDGAIISEEAYAMLVELGLASKSFADKLPVIINAVVMNMLFLGLFAAYLFVQCRETFKNRKQTALLFTIVIAVIVIVRLLEGIPYQFMPIFIATLLVSMLINTQLGIVTSIFVTFISQLILKADATFVIFFISGGFALALMAKYITVRNQMLIGGLLASVTNFAIMFFTSYLTQKIYSKEALMQSSYAAMNGIFSVIVCLGSLPFWEQFFGVITNLRLLDLTNPSNSLMRKLVIEAPGTYHHSLIVANLAETAAYDVGADAGLARVGGYYHDIGKLKHPLYFVENQAGENPHNYLDPKASADVIMGHVSYGMELADDYKLPQPIKDIIIEHHGTTLIQYFYCKEKEREKAEGEEKLDEADFRYPFRGPQSRESAIVMLADTVEAAIRSMINAMKDNTEIEPNIRKLIKCKLDDGQLLDSQLSIKDLDTIAKSFAKVFKGMYHERIPYPAMKDAKPAGDKAAGLGLAGG
ncbi:MAG: HDIG domain-containing protein [Clostridiales bacterium]|jgi:putative nucleotidyltransferase with HDIG domain|nr:HDIG domain-containing protein [Clostridiales bacterium]